MLWLLKDVAKEDVQVIALAPLPFQLVWWTVANGRVAEDRSGSFSDILVQYLVLVHKKVSQTVLLLLACLQLSEVNAIVKFFQVRLSSEFDSIQQLWVIAPLVLDFDFFLIE